MNKNYYAVLMAGGVGSRFWPVSTQSYPKQFHDMLGTGQSLIQLTFNRLASVIPKENIYILTNQVYRDLVYEQLPDLTAEQVVLEPAMRNTAPCILYAALKIAKKNPDATMIVAPSDHWIEDEVAFKRDILKAFEFCDSNDALMTLGIQPTGPNTGYGYIEYDRDAKSAIRKVVQFREKPDLEKAQRFLEQGNFLWNAGIFLWHVNSLIRAFKAQQPEMYTLFEAGIPSYNTEDEQRFISDNYVKATNISIDYAVMENSPNVYVLPASFDWNDLGTWGSLYDKKSQQPGENVAVNARLETRNAEGNMIYTGSNKIVCIEGLDDFIIVDRDDVLLIMPKEKEQEIKELRARIGDQFGDQHI